MSPIIIPDSFNYIGAFLTFACQLRCAYCINQHSKLDKKRWMSGDDWIKGLNRIRTRGDLPITLQGGEPTMHKHFFKIANGIDSHIPIDLMTNLEIGVGAFMQGIPSNRIKRNAPYASIRVSYHHGQNDFYALIKKVARLEHESYHIGIWEVDHPAYHEDVLKRQEIARHIHGIDYRLKEFLGMWKGELYGTMRYDGAVSNLPLRSCSCLTSELLIGPAGNLFRCHSDLYAGRSSIGHLLDERLDKLDVWRNCSRYGDCNPCDVKIKTNRFQIYGHSSVEIRDINSLAL